MNFGQLLSGDSVFVDANTFVYYFGAHPTFGTPCKQLLDRIEHRDLHGFTSAHELLDLTHRLMTLEAATTFGWPLAGMANRLRRSPVQVRTLTQYRQAIDEISLIGIQVLPVTAQLVSLAADVSQQTGLLSGDALIVATMQKQGLSKLASHDADFDRVPGVTRYAPV
jgi:predicted nucleic acid-binding protein